MVKQTVACLTTMKISLHQRPQQRMLLLSRSKEIRAFLVEMEVTTTSSRPQKLLQRKSSEVSLMIVVTTTIRSSQEKSLSRLLSPRKIISLMTTKKVMDSYLRKSQKFLSPRLRQKSQRLTIVKTAIKALNRLRSPLRNLLPPRINLRLKTQTVTTQCLLQKNQSQQLPNLSRQLSKTNFWIVMTTMMKNQTSKSQSLSQSLPLSPPRKKS